ncbi:MAG: carboxypeptidase-like regulatory domain-containing protein, partial [Terriglobia bacterium]
MRSYPRKVGCFIGLFALCFGAMLWSQTPSGVILKGHVTGPGGISVPGAQVVLINPQTRQRKETWTDADGNYVFTAVPPGTYRLVVMLVGFRPAIAGPVTVKAGSPSQQNISLALATPGQGAGFGGFNRRNGTGSATARGAGQYGGNAAASGGAGNIPGLAAGESGEAQLSFSGQNGGTSSEQEGQGESSGLEQSASAANSFLLAGNMVDATAPAQRRGRGNWRFRAFAMGQMGGPVTIRGGQAPGVPFSGGGPGGGPMFFFGGRRNARVNRIRGNIFDYYSNSALDARPFPLNRAPEPQIPFHSERLGISLGGPLSIPKIYPNGANKTSFFVHYNTTLSTRANDLFDSVPTLAERSGDFSDALVNGLTPAIYEPSSGPLGPRTPFPGNVIPSSLFSPAAAGLLPYVPLPNLPG